MKKKIIMGLFVLATVIGMGFAEEKKSTSYYNGYIHATEDYSKGNDYNPSYCSDKKYGRTIQGQYDCIQGYQDSWKTNSEAAPKTQTENTNSEE